MIAFTREDIRHSVAAAEDVGEIQTAEEEMLYKVFDFAEKEAADVMVPRPDVVGLSIDLPPDEALRKVLESPYTRYPVYRESLDDIVGILHIRALVEALEDREIDAGELERLLHPAYVVPETKDLAALLAEFRKANQHMAVVVDEYGATAGIVTLEDILEEIVGDIEDEFDLPDESVERLDDDANPDLGVVHDRRLQRAVRQLDRRRGLPHRRRLRVREPRARRRDRRRSSWTRPQVHRPRDERVANPAARGRVPPRSRRRRRHARSGLTRREKCDARTRRTFRVGSSVIRIRPRALAT